MGGLGLRSVAATRHSAYFASLMQMLPHFAKLHAELHSVAAFQQTRLHAELSRCKQVLLERRASNTFDLGVQSRPAGVPAAPACAANLCSALPLKLISLQSRTSPQRLHHCSLRLMQLLPLDAASHPPLPPSSPPAFRRPPLRSLRAPTTAGSERLLLVSPAPDPAFRPASYRASSFARWKRLHGSSCSVAAAVTSRRSSPRSHSTRPPARG